MNSFDFGVCPLPHGASRVTFGPDVSTIAVFTLEGVTVGNSVLDFQSAYGTGFADGGAPGPTITSLGVGAVCGE